MRPLPRAVPWVLVFAAGCSSPPPPVEAPPPTTYDAVAMADRAMADYDRNNSGFIEGAELDACPALKGSLIGIDTNRDGKLSKDELKARFEEYGAANAAMMAAFVTVTLDGKPLAGATVKLAPEPCMGPAAREVTATTGADGTASKFTLEGKEYQGLPLGLYKAKITGPAGAALPARYNTQTTLGGEVSGGRGAGPLKFALSSR
ncbi:MAG: hypothetical protein ACKODX_08135 [Gemmata sp.]